MAWLALGEINLTQDWEFTIPVVGEVFRIIHKPINNTDNKYLKAVVAQGFVDEKLNIFNPQRLSYRSESEIFTFYFPSGIAQQKLCLKRLDYTDIDWIIEAEVYQAANPLEELSNYLKARFGETTIMDYLVSTSSGFRSVFPTTVETMAEFSDVTEIVGRNPNRLHLIIRAGLQEISLFTNIAADGSGLNLIEKVPAGQLFILPNNGGIYKGDIFAQSAVAASDISITEYA
ncbi:hypothetical protein [Brunnivagina elsteri]|uniref:Uncharacterized protein n=1 Tax=Brunnivagina elsteri CCALA 953 TaxID=987040 RepID=A0A2A2TNL4_9CYAN|nr:hypothetical protein [Calothrix elsteri]PAX60040.1 hypothetical protein CK510_04000 [Calothrix elsteri CCALA 953]